MKSLRITIVLLILLPVIFGCGRKTMPVPPQGVLPAPITDLSFVLEDGGVTLTWSYPTRMVNGDELSGGVDGFELVKAVVAIEESCAGCPLPYKSPRDLDDEDLIIKDGRVQYHEDLKGDTGGNRYYYKIRSQRARTWRSSGDSNEIFFDWLPAK